MAYTPGYTYDIFISYAHLDNLKVFHQAQGWIEEFYAELDILLSRRIGKANAVKFWWDNKKLDGSMVFDTFIDESIQQSAIMISLVSPAYLQSEYCLRELKLFYNKAQKEAIGLHPGNRNRILNVLLNNIPYAGWPKELGGTTGFKFNDAKDDEDFGDTFETNSEAFKEGLRDLRDAIIKLTEELKKTEAPPSLPKFSIFFADVSDSLRQLKKRTITELKSQLQDCELISDIPPPYEDTEHEDTVKEKLKSAKLTVHLFDQYPGREVEGNESIWYPQKQAELSFASPQTQLIWVPLDMNIENVEEDKYKQFLKELEAGKQGDKNIRYIRGIKSELTQQIIDISNKMLAENKKPSKGRISVLLDTHYEDQLYALELSKILIENGIQPFINPEEDDPKKNIDILDDRIAQVSKLVFFYGKVSSDWITERINAALQLIVSNKYPKKDFYVFTVPPHKEATDLTLFQTWYLPIQIFDNSNATQIDFATLQHFFKAINATA